MKKIALNLLIICVVFSSCTQNADRPPVEPVAQILKDIMSLLVYNQRYLRLAEDFISYDEHGYPLEKGPFLERLATGDYLALRLKTDRLCYKLAKFPSSASVDQRRTMAQVGKRYSKYYQMEGQPIPAYDFLAIDGRHYSSANSKGKIMVIKCWFISCLPCRQEMPALNQLVKKYADRKDIEFVSLAFDTKEELLDFKKTNVFNYAIVPAMEDYMRNKLKADMYPTHILIDKHGRMVKVVNKVNELTVALAHETKK